MSEFICEKCLRVFTRKCILQNHLRRKTPCNDKNSKIIYDDNDKLLDNQFAIPKQSQNDFSDPVNLRKNPRKLPTFPENLRETAGKFTKNPENLRNTLEIYEIPSKCTKNPANVRKTLEIDEKPQKIQCEICQKTFTHRNNLYRHRKQSCKGRIKDQEVSDQNELKSLKSRIKLLEDLNESKLYEPKTNINQNIFQVLCVGNNDNYLDMLTVRMGSFDKAIDYIRDCALSSLSGDCKLLERIYFQEGVNPVNYPIKFIDKQRKKIEYIDEKNQKVIDIKGIFLSKKLANNLQKTYLKGVNHLLLQNTDDKSLADYDIQSWNNHIYDLSEVKYQSKLINNLDIPTIV